MTRPLEPLLAAAGGGEEETRDPRPKTPDEGWRAQQQQQLRAWEEEEVKVGGW